MPDKKNKPLSTEEKKKIILRIGVIFFISLVFLLWLFNIRGIIFQDSEANLDREYWQGLRQEIVDNFEDFNVIWTDLQDNQAMVDGQELVETLKERIEAEAQPKIEESKERVIKEEPEIDLQEVE